MFSRPLPYEVHCLIFSYLNKQDCLQCLLVCHNWNVSIPRYTHAIWTKVVVNSNKIISCDRNSINIGSLVRFLGPHVRSINLSIEEDGFNDSTCSELRALLELLAPAQCHSLGKPMHVVIKGTVRRFNGLLRGLAHHCHVRRLILTLDQHLAVTFHGVGHEIRCFFHTLLDLCPSLTHLDISLWVKYLGRVSQSTPNELISSPATTQLQYLRLALMHNNHSICDMEILEPVLRRCKALVWLCVSSEHPLVDDRLLRLCPILGTLQWRPNASKNHTSWLCDLDTMASSGDNGLRTLSITRCNFFNTLLAEPGDHLRHLSTIMLYNYGAAEQVRWPALRNCPALSRIGLKAADPSSLHSLSTLRHLKKIQLVICDNAVIDPLIDFLVSNGGRGLEHVSLDLRPGLIRRAVLVALATRPALKSLSLHNAQVSDHYLRLFFQQAAAAHSTLQGLKVDTETVGWIRAQTLMALCDLRHLRSVVLQSNGCKLRGDGLRFLADKKENSSFKLTISKAVVDDDDAVAYLEQKLRPGYLKYNL